MIKKKLRCIIHGHSSKLYRKVIYTTSFTNGNYTKKRIKPFPVTIIKIKCSICGKLIDEFKFTD